VKNTNIAMVHRGAAPCWQLLAQIRVVVWHLRICTGPKKRWKIGHLFVLLQIKKNKYTNGEWSFCMHISVSGQQNHLFYKTNAQMHHVKAQPLQQPFAPSFTYLRICVLG
jgi:hypothetical protein